MVQRYSELLSLASSAAVGRGRFGSGEGFKVLASERVVLTLLPSLPSESRPLLVTFINNGMLL
jgi:hypothetical protein